MPHLKSSCSMRTDIEASSENSQNIQASNTIPQSESFKMQWCSLPVLQFYELNRYNWRIAIVWRAWDLAHLCHWISVAELPLNCAVSLYVKCKRFASGSSSTTYFRRRLPLVVCSYILSAMQICFCSPDVWGWCHKLFPVKLKELNQNMQD